MCSEREKEKGDEYLRRSLFFTLTSVLLVVMLSACDSNPQVTLSDIDQIKLELLNTTELPEGTAYSIKLKNNSTLTIAQNNVYISFPIKTSTGIQSSGFKLEARNNKLGIKPDEEIILNAFVPNTGMVENPKLDTAHVQVEIAGYLEEVKEESRFQKIGDLD